MNDHEFSETLSDSKTDREIEERASGSLKRDGSAASTWTIVPPTCEGWFWKLDYGQLEIVKVKRQRAYGNQLCCLHGANYGMVEQSINALWAGPIHPPSEPPNVKVSDPAL